MARTLVVAVLALGVERVLCDVSAPRDTGMRWALHFSTGMGKGVKVAASELLVDPPRSLAALAVAERAGQDPLTPGFAYAPPAQTCEPSQEGEQANQCVSRDLAYAESGFGFGWFVPMGGGKAGKSYSPMTRYSNTSLLAPEGDALSETATKLSRGIRSTTVFVHTRGGGQLALANSKNAPPFLVNADPNHQRAAHSLVQKKNPPNLMWMQCGSLPNFQWMRPLLLSHIGRTRADLITGQSDSEHTAALFASLLVQNRSKVCEDPHGEPVTGVHSESMCEDTGRHWVTGEAGSCTRMGATPVDGIGTESDCMAAGYTWTAGKEAQCVDQSGTVYEPPSTTNADGVAVAAPPLTPVTCAKTGNRWLDAVESKSANKGKTQPILQFSAAELSEAIARLVSELDAVDQDPARGELGEKASGSGLECGPETSGLNAAVGDGRALVIVRARACPDLLPPPLYVSIGAAWDPKRGVTTAASSTTPDDEGVVTVVVASEPMADALSDVADRWEGLATDEMILIHSEDMAIAEAESGADSRAFDHEGPAVIQRWCLSQRCLEEVAARPEGAARPVLHAATVPAPDGAAELHRPASARTYKLKSGAAAPEPPATGSLQGEADEWKPPGTATVKHTEGVAKSLVGAGGKLAGADDWVPPSSAGSAAGTEGRATGGGRLAGADDWQPPGAPSTRAMPPVATAAGSSDDGVLKGSPSSQPPTAIIQETGLGGATSGGVRHPRRLDSSPPPPPRMPPSPPPLHSSPPTMYDDDESWVSVEQQRREKAERREQQERDRHKATQERLARDRAFREEERLRHAEHQQKEQDAWDRAAQRRRQRQQEEDGVDSVPQSAPSSRGGSTVGKKMTMRGWLGAARLDAYHKDFEVGHSACLPTCQRIHPPEFEMPSCFSVSLSVFLCESASADSTARCCLRTDRCFNPRLQLRYHRSLELRQLATLRTSQRKT